MKCEITLKAKRLSIQFLKEIWMDNLPANTRIAKNRWRSHEENIRNKSLPRSFSKTTLPRDGSTWNTVIPGLLKFRNKKRFVNEFDLLMGFGRFVCCNGISAALWAGVEWEFDDLTDLAFVEGVFGEAVWRSWRNFC